MDSIAPLPGIGRPKFNLRACGIEFRRILQRVLASRDGILLCDCMAEEMTTNMA